MMATTKNDLEFLKGFVEYNWKLITMNHEYSFHINSIYERAIFFSKQSKKLEAICKKMNSSTTLKLYEFNP